MSEQLQLRRGTAAQVAAFTGAQGEVVIDTTNNRLVVQDGATAGGFAAAKLAEALPVSGGQASDLGIGTAADPSNPLSVKASTALFSAASADFRVVIDKAAAANTASLLYQDGFSGRAEIGLTGDDNFHFKVSPDGATWFDALDIAAASGTVSASVGLAVAGRAVAKSANVVTFATSGTYTPTPGMQLCDVYLIGAGGGGGGGCLEAASTACSGGGGGGGGANMFGRFTAAQIGASVSVAVGAGGVGGVAATSSSTAGGGGSAGGVSTFGALLAGRFGGGGAGGQISASASGGGGAAGPTGGGASSTGSSGGNANIGAGAGGSGTTGGNATLPTSGAGGAGCSAAGVAGAGGYGWGGGPGGGSGGGVTSGGVASVGGAGGQQISNSFTTAGGAGGAANANGSAGAAAPGSFMQAAGSGGAAGNGGAGGVSAGGGGGGAMVNGGTAGAGGAGGAGLCVIVEYF